MGCAARYSCCSYFSTRSRFCAGQDLNDRVVDPDSAVPDTGLSIEKYYNPLIKLITEMPKPVICAVNGVAAGAGANIALACDLVLAAKSASFIGFSAVWGWFQTLEAHGSCRGWLVGHKPWDWHYWEIRSRLSRHYSSV